MPKARYIAPVNYREEDLPALKALEEILSRENKSFSEWARERTVEYVKAHGKGNPQYDLGDWVRSPDVRAYPTAWKILGRDDLEPYSKEELEEMEHLLAMNLQTLKNVQRIPVPTKDTGKAR